jgi:exopolysaccharide biosynthesis polyprenyl glycosylphosphotransferase
MSKTSEKCVLFLIDFLTINTAFFVWCEVRRSLGFISAGSFFRILTLSLLVFVFWLFSFIFFGNYRTWFTRSRTDEFISVVKAVTAGVIVIFLVTFDVQNDFNHPVSLSRIMIISYWGMLIFFVATGRILLWSIKRRLLSLGIGRRRALIIGWGEKSKNLFNQVLEAPALGYDIIGFVAPGMKPHQASYKNVPVRGPLKQLNTIIQKETIQEILIAFSRRSEHQLEKVIAQCDGTPVGIKIVPDLYDVIIGQAKTNQIYGFPLIEILPQLMPAWELIIKRLADIGFSLLLLLGLFPLWIVFAGIIRIDSKGTIFYIQKRVGKDGKIYNMIKFRSMVAGAEKITGPVWASYNDPRVTRFGRFLRKFRLDEIPQLINVIKGDMSWVGPRPERPYFVEKFKKKIPLYGRRLRIRPGITGWAQIKGKYDQSLENVKNKLEYDLFYLENMSLRMDLKIVLNTLYVMIRARGQ